LLISRRELAEEVSDFVCESRILAAEQWDAPNLPQINL
jgi:hypothetical protein